MPVFRGTSFMPPCARILVPIVAAVLVCGPSLAQHAAGDNTAIRVTHAWARASVGPSGAAYLTIENSGDTADRLVSAATEIADKAEFHTSEMEGDIMRMRPVGALDVPPNGMVTFEPGGKHLMLMGLNRKLVEGESFPLTLVFDKAGEVTVTVEVRAMGAMCGMREGHGRH